jgi:RNA polymerase sigma-70 factor, ECF subfamily
MDLKKEKQLVEDARHSSNAFGKLYDTYYPKIFRYTLRRTANFEVSLDITSEVFLKALKHIATYEWRDLPFSSWLYKIATNEIADFFSKKKYQNTSLDKLLNKYDFEPASLENLEEELMDAQEKLQRHQTFLEIQKEIIRLDMLYQEVISLRFFENKKIKEIALILGKSEGTIKSQLSRGLEKLRQRLIIKQPAMQPFKKIRVIPVGVKTNE